MSLNICRHLPTIDIYSVIWDGCLNRLLYVGEKYVAEYLGPYGHCLYTKKYSVAELRETLQIAATNPEDKDVLLFSYHWSGLLGQIPGTDCGDQPQEAFHSPWTNQIAESNKSADYNKALQNMQNLYHGWESQCDWSGTNTLQMTPPRLQAGRTQGNWLIKLGRTNCFEFQEKRRAKA